jgi:hypothetical protein
MPNEISIQGLMPISSSGDTTTEPKGEASVSHPVPTPGAARQPYVNPSLRLDAALGLVVIEFRDDSGTITSSIPSQRQLEAYRQHEQAPPNTTDSRVSTDARASTGTPGTAHPTGTFGTSGRPADRFVALPRADSHPAARQPAVRGDKVVMPAHKA